VEVVVAVGAYTVAPTAARKDLLNISNNSNSRRTDQSQPDLLLLPLLLQQRPPQQPTITTTPHRPLDRFVPSRPLTLLLIWVGHRLTVILMHLS
jgi:hypothetical protein